jgi:hypothetical protein
MYGGYDYYTHYFNGFYCSIILIYVTVDTLKKAL